MKDEVSVVDCLVLVATQLDVQLLVVVSVYMDFNKLFFV